MKKLHKTQWLELALDKKNSTRPFVTSLYRATNELVATDGNRLHLQSGLVDSPTYMLSNEDVAYPDYKLAMQEKGEDFEIQLSPDSYNNIISVLTYATSVRFTAVVLKIEGARLSIAGARDEVNINVTVLLSSIGKESFTAHYSPKYLRDAFRIFEATGTNTATLNILDDKSPLHIKADDLHAVVMPMKA